MKEYIKYAVFINNTSCVLFFVLVRVLLHMYLFTLHLVNKTFTSC